MKFYRYRPLSELLFKELYYQEIYFASYAELNDPLDMSIQIDFRPSEIKYVNYLLNFINRCHFILNNYKYLKQCDIFPKYKNLRDRIWEKTNNYSPLESISLNRITEIIEMSINELSSDFYFDGDIFKSEVVRLRTKLFKKSCVSCFSETNNNFLMWSHYASKHTGICLEFTIENKSFPFELIDSYNKDSVEYEEGVATWQGRSIRYEDEIREVQYQPLLPTINFFNFSYVFANENDCDVVGISKSWMHPYANEVADKFLIKTPVWEYEKEWRIISMNFETNEYPEKRIRNYPLEYLTGIYFGINTSIEVKNRIIAIMESKHNNKIKYYEAQLKGSSKIRFIEFQFGNHENI